METTSPETANYYLRFGWKLLSQYTVAATEDSPEKTCYVLAAVAGLEDTRRLLDVPDVATANAYLDLGWRLIDKYVSTPELPSAAPRELTPPGSVSPITEPSVAQPDVAQPDAAGRDATPRDATGAPGDEHCLSPRRERIHFVLAWQRDEPPPGAEAPKFIREHITYFESNEEIAVEP